MIGQNKRFVAKKKKRYVAKKKKRYVAKHLLEKTEKIKMGQENEIIRTWSRASTITPSMVGRTIAIHNGKEHIPVYITESMIGYKLGEFVPTRFWGIDAINDNDNKSVMKNQKK